MKEVTRNALVGLFVMASLATLAILMVMFGETPSWLGGGDWELTIVNVRDIRNIGDGSPVRLNGVDIGRVARLEFKNPERPDRGVNIVAKIKKTYVVPRGAVAKVYSPTLGLGTGRVEIVVDPQGDISAVPQKGGEILGHTASALAEVISPDMVNAFERMISNIGDLAARAGPVADAVADLMEQRTVQDVDRNQVTANLSTAAERIDDLVAHINTVLGDTDVQGDVRGIASDLKSTSEELRALVALWTEESRKVAENVNEGIDRTDENLNIAISKLITVAENLDSSTKSLANVMQGIAEGKGTAGLLVRDPRLYEAADLALTRLADVLASVLRITSKIERDGYITVAKETPVGPFRRKFPLGGEKPVTD